LPSSLSTLDGRNCAELRGTEITRGRTRARDKTNLSAIFHPYRCVKCGINKIKMPIVVEKLPIESCRLLFNTFISLEGNYLVTSHLSTSNNLSENFFSCDCSIKRDVTDATCINSLSGSRVISHRISFEIFHKYLNAFQLIIIAKCNKTDCDANT